MGAHVNDWFLVLVLVVYVALFAVVYRYARRALPSMAIVSGWVALTGQLTETGFFADFSLPPRIPIFLVIQFAALIWLVFRSPWRDALTAIPQPWLVGLQTFRLGVELVLAGLATQSLLPVEMSFHGRNFDLLTGATAPVVALLAYRYGAGRWLVGWNLAGLALVSWVVGHGILSVPYPFQVLHLSVDNFIIARFPFCWLPFFLVPVAYGLHLISLRALLGGKR